MRYKYLASTPQGEMRAGELEAETEKEAEEALWQAGLTILRLRKLKKDGGGLHLESLSPTLFGVRRGEIIHFTRSLANLLGAGISEVPSLKMLQAQTSGPFGRVLNRVIEDISRGDSFSQALARHPQVFSTLYLRLIHVGEEIGSLPLVLRQLEVHLERERETAIRVRGALGYPAFIAVLAVGVVVILVTFVLPSMRALLREWGGSLPLSTRALVAIASFLRERAGLVMVALSLGVVGASWYIRSPRGSARWDRFLLRVPQVRRAIIFSQIARFCRTLSLLLKAGVTLTEGLNLLVQTTENAPFREVLTGVRADVVQGKLLSQALASRPLFPPLVGQLVSIGEHTGQLEVNLDTVVTSYDEEAGRAIARLVGMLEPALIILVGGVVAFIAVSILSPLYGLVRQIR